MVVSLIVALTFLCPEIALAQSPSGPLVSCLETREEGCIAATKGIARRKGEKLTLTFADGRKRTFKSNQKACDKDDAERCEDYGLVGFVPDTKTYIVRTTGYEGSEFLFLSYESTGQLKIGAAPIFSPDQIRFAVVDCDYGAMVCPIGVWRLDKFPPAKEFYETPPGDRSWRIVRWTDEKQVEVETDMQTEQPSEKGILRLTEGKWIFSKKR
ncbi:hypothetical protein B1812_11740 [Methylocystis bryophila]|uniref:Uncharacterized protein n=1 Tax=Methylocystis bryophila TaxID=655015 RepID=A0A1W6MVJ7_9HYPH|nr:hypothetical protein B1812_11740 [Methylocystis bryophila]